MRRSCILSTLLFLNAVVTAQPERLIFRTFTTLDGLPSLAVTGVLQDSTGIVWVATERGVVGSYHTSFVPERSFLYQYFETGPLRVARSRTTNGFFVFGPNGQARQVSYVRVSHPRMLNVWEGFEHRLVFPEWYGDSTYGAGFTAATETRDGKIVLGSNGGGIWIRQVPASDSRRESWIYRGSPLRHLPFREVVTALEPDTSGTVWIGTTQGLSRIEGDRIVPDRTTGLGNVSVTALYLDPYGTLWIGTPRGLYRLSGSRAQRVEVVGQRHVTAVTMSISGTLWIGTASDGLIRLQGSQATVFDEEDGIASRQVICVAVDFAENVYVGTDRGLTKILASTYDDYRSGVELPAGKWFGGLQARDGSMWFGGTGAISRISNRRTQGWTAPLELRSMEFRQLLQDSAGVMWALVDGGVIRFDRGVFRFFRDDSAMNGADGQSLMVYHPLQGVVVMRPRIVRRLRGDRFETIIARSSGRTYNGVIVDDRGDLWVSDWSGCVSITSQGVVTTYPFLNGSVGLQKTASGSVAVVDPAYGVIFADELEAARRQTAPIAWSMKKGGPESYPVTSGFVDADGRRFIFYQMSQLREQSAPGVVDGPIIDEHQSVSSAILMRRSGTFLILRRPSGIAELEEFDPRSNTMRPQPFVNGILASRFDLSETEALGTMVGAQASRITESNDGRLWFATSTGIVAIPAPGESFVMAPTISEIRAGDIRLLPGLVESFGAVSTMFRWWKETKRGHLAGFADSSEFVVRAEDNDLQFVVWSKQHQSELGVLFQARLEGLDSTWSRPMTDGTFAFRDVPQGRYVFRARTVMPDGRISPERTAVVAIIVPFWRTSWFVTISALTAAYLVVQVTSRRIRRLREQHARMTKQAVQENELRMARAVQMGMLPDRCPEVRGFDISARSMPAAEVGGDFYDFIQDGERVGIAVGDVSGHGITGAMIVGMARTSLRFASSRFDRPSRVLTLANDRLRQDISRNVFIAMFYGILDPKKRTLNYICAGQPIPILIRGGKAAFVPTGRGDRFPLGIVPHVSYREEQLTLRRGDLLVLYTDGLVEAMNAAREEYGFDRFLRTLESHAHRAGRDFIDAVVADVQAHAAGASQEDDMTMVVVRMGKEERS